MNVPCPNHLGRDYLAATSIDSIFRGSLYFLLISRRHRQLFGDLSCQPYPSQESIKFSFIDILVPWRLTDESSSSVWASSLYVIYVVPTIFHLVLTILGEHATQNLNLNPWPNNLQSACQGASILLFVMTMTKFVNITSESVLLFCSYCLELPNSIRLSACAVQILYYPLTHQIGWF